MSEEDINSNMDTILNRVDEEIKKYVAESADKIHSCKNCNIETTEFRCGKCQKAYYCSKECQVENWKTHKPACKKFCKQKNDTSGDAL
uniref:MYND-type domain-containing protein n=1 Tax=viral metagenome TaxID=1070528 RepID=A0A6C0I0E5_9ZZZZ